MARFWGPLLTAGMIAAASPASGHNSIPFYTAQRELTETPQKFLPPRDYICRYQTSSKHAPLQASLVVEFNYDPQTAAKEKDIAAGITYGPAQFTFRRKGIRIAQYMLSGIGGLVMSTKGNVAEVTINSGRADLAEYQNDCLKKARDGNAYYIGLDGHQRPVIIKQSDKRNTQDAWRDRMVSIKFTLQ